jgi:hypothetical protein
MENIVGNMKNGVLAERLWCACVKSMVVSAFSASELDIMSVMSELMPSELGHVCTETIALDALEANTISVACTPNLLLQLRSQFALIQLGSRYGAEG